MRRVIIDSELIESALRDTEKKIKAGIDKESAKRAFQFRPGFWPIQEVDIKEVQAVVHEGQLAFRFRMTIRCDITMIFDSCGNTLTAFPEKVQSKVEFQSQKVKIYSNETAIFLNYYGLIRHPFRTSPDPGFFWLGEKHKEALALLVYGILKQDGFMLLTGEVGTGKTSIIKYLLKVCTENQIIATINDPDMDVVDFYNFLAEEFKLNRKFISKADFLIEFKKFLLNAYFKHKPVFIIIDEAQRINHESFEEIRLLSNIELDDQKLINIFFIGQMEIESKLKDPKNRAIAQRITMSYNLEPLDEPETKKYIIHRLHIAGAKRGIFTADACKEIFFVSHGIPRLINSICDCALMTAYSRDWKVVDAKTIRECKIDLKIPIGTISN